MGKRKPKPICVLCCSAQPSADDGNNNGQKRSSFKSAVESQLTLLKFYNEIITQSLELRNCGSSAANHHNNKKRSSRPGPKSSKTVSAPDESSLASTMMMTMGFNILEGFPVCSSCFVTVKTVTCLGDKVAEVKSRIRVLESQLLGEQQELQRRLEEFYAEMRKVGGIVKKSEVMMSGDIQQGTDGVVALRKNIASVVNSLARSRPERTSAAALVNQEVDSTGGLLGIGTENGQHLTQVKVEVDESDNEEEDVDEETDDTGMAWNDSCSSSSDSEARNLKKRSTARKQERSRRKRKKSQGSLNGGCNTKVRKLSLAVPIPNDSSRNDGLSNCADDTVVGGSQDTLPSISLFGEKFKEKYVGMRKEDEANTTNKCASGHSCDELVELYPNTGVKMKQCKLDALIAHSSQPTYLARNLFRVLFTEEELSSHTMFGKMCNAMAAKGHVPLPAIDATRRDAVINFILKELDLEHGAKAGKVALAQRKAAKREIIKTLSDLLREENRKTKTA